MRSGELLMPMKKYFTIAVIGILCITSILITGCTGKDQMTRADKTTIPTPLGTAVQVGDLVFTEKENNATVSVSQGNTITLQLPENPTTGYQWNLTTTPGLDVTNDTYVPSDTTGRLVGSGGIHIWQISVNNTGRQEISAIYKRSWEPATGNETGFGMTLLVQ